ncbi:MULTISPECIES: helix-turn-helix domain-containing protein [unclassified Paenibacillus]|uniref:helix-turn-helix domain-containing protein n=1 Tax=unclassified Paenibacillus TaxID=185978 RepID=UPI0009A5A7A6|nr:MULTISPECIES: helix-turn-helix transcriptional regulator [unclassified Paenibacillus]SLJ92783.1 DNA-binding transcriptional regulator, XRE-family HTH domain [Paenibacillus sp. RU5A]SOC58500.1 DNA-binding transcriptional regulator, XRE-family HTH domain [Paenibacillus sp. RU26A]SOC67552.1 DNA-binding transcriptional regulator, XRE-family HTH domain [Paenibacillus sp. RU5M]
MKIGDKLTQLRNKKTYTQDQMAELLDIKRARYNAWENNISKPDIEMIAKLAAIHNVSVDFLLGVEQNADGKIIPPWATPKDKRDFKRMLEEDEEVMFDGVPIADEDKEKIIRVMEAMFWDAKKKNKRKPIDD